MNLWTRSLLGKGKPKPLTSKMFLDAMKKIEIGPYVPPVITVPSDFFSSRWHKLHGRLVKNYGFIDPRCVQGCSKCKRNLKRRKHGTR